MLATSQAPLSVRGEHAWAVAPLSGPSGASRDSVELFVDRARMARADFALNAENESAVVEICERLDHVPLAIELAAARVRGMTPADIARRLDQRLRLLASSDQLAPGRHRTLDAAVRWSYELLDETQRRVFDRLACSRGRSRSRPRKRWSSGDGVDEWEVLDGILALVDKSLVVADETAGATRYRLLETMRQFGNANLTAAGIDALYRRPLRRLLRRLRVVAPPAAPRLRATSPRSRTSSASSRTSASRCARPPTTTARHASRSSSARCSRSGTDAAATRRARRGRPSSSVGPIWNPAPASWRWASPHR